MAVVGDPVLVGLLRPVSLVSRQGGDGQLVIEQLQPMEPVGGGGSEGGSSEGGEKGGGEMGGRRQPLHRRRQHHGARTSAVAAGVVVVVGGLRGCTPGG